MSREKIEQLSARESACNTEPHTRSQHHSRSHRCGAHEPRAAEAAVAGRTDCDHSPAVGDHRAAGGARRRVGGAVQRLMGAPQDCSNSALPPAQSPKPNRPERQPKQKRGPKPGHEGHSRRRQVGRSASARQRSSRSPDAMLTGPWLSDIVPSVTLSTFGGAVAQRFRVPACQAGSRGFKSRQPRQSYRGARPHGRLAHVRHEGLTTRTKTFPHPVATVPVC